MSPIPERKPQKPNRRREGREAALQLLYSHENLPSLAEDGGLDTFWQMRAATPDVRRHAETLWRGCCEHRESIDTRLAGVIENFSLDRLAAVDRNILRVAVFEMFHDTKVPPVVSLNEAVEIAKRFGGEDSAKFINGVLDRLLKSVERKLR